MQARIAGSDDFGAGAAGAALLADDMFLSEGAAGERSDEQGKAPQGRLRLMVFSVNRTTDGARHGGGPAATALAREGLAWLCMAARSAAAAILVMGRQASM